MTNPVKHIVIADDDPDDVEIFQAAVAETCFHLQLTVATDGVKLMNLLDRIPAPDAIFLDLNMPAKNGKECLVEIRSKDEFKHIPILILSTSGQVSEIDFCLNNGASHYLIKPDTYDGIKSIVTNLCNGDFFEKVA